MANHINPNLPSATSLAQAHFGYLFAPAPGNMQWPDAAKLGSKGGPMELVEHGKLGLIPDSLGDADNPTIPAAFTYLGQLIDHDISRDEDSRKDPVTLPPALRNYRTPRFDLDNIYGDGPAGSPKLYSSDRESLLVGFVSDDQTLYMDLPRDSNGIAFVGDDRQDENLIVAQLHVAFLHFHNAVLIDVRARKFESQRLHGETDFGLTRRLVCWHYQWIVLKHYLPAICGADVVDNVLKSGRKLYDPNDQDAEPMMPVEFSAAAFRFGHSQIQAGYAINAYGVSGKTTELPIFVATQAGTMRADLRGGAISSEHRVDWRFLIYDGTDVPFGVTRFSSRIDTKIADHLLDLPTDVAPGSLATLDLLKAERLKVCSGEAAVAAANKVGLGIALLPPEEIWAGDFKSYGAADTPLWFYILREAEQQPQNGERLGALGARIVAEVIIGLLQKDAKSYVNAQPAWTPTLAPGGDFTLVDLLVKAGVSPAYQARRQR